MIKQDSSEHNTMTANCSFHINSDWAEFALLTPSAKIQFDPESDINKKYKDHVTYSHREVNLNTRNRKVVHNAVLEFKIQSDGPPVSIELSHGSAGAVEGAGNCFAIINDETYHNLRCTDNGSNSKTYNSVPLT